MEKTCTDNNTGECEYYLKFIVVYILSLAILFLFVKGFLYLNIFDIKEQPSDLILALLGIITLCCTLWEYRCYRKREKAEVLGQYNERYSKDEHINKVVPFLISDIMKVKAEKPSAHNVEMFMRFFEEMELQIDKDRLDANSVYELFSYYALYLDSKPNLLKSLSIDDYNEDYWELFLKFINRMAKINFKDSVWHCGEDVIRFDDGCHVIMNNILSYYSYQSGMLVFMQDSKEIQIKHNMRGVSIDKKYVEELIYEDKIYIKEANN